MSEYTCNKKTPHAHAELIKAWADGAAIQYLYRDGEWVDVGTSGPTWSSLTCYRIKPEPKPDVVKYASVDIATGHQYWVSLIKKPGANVTFTFDGETGKLKSAEVIA